jgi:hypothetical protein
MFLTFGYPGLLALKSVGMISILYIFTKMNIKNYNLIAFPCLVISIVVLNNLSVIL